MSQLDLDVIPVGYEGLDTESAADKVFKGAAPEVINLLPHRDGQLIMRGPIEDHTELVLGADEIIGGVWCHGDSALVSIVDQDSTSVRMPHNAPRVSGVAADLVGAELTMKKVDFGAMTVSDVTTTLDRIIYGRNAIIAGTSYGFGLTSATSDSTNRGYVRRRSLLAWDGTTSAPTVVVDAPDSGLDVKVHYNRLFVLGGRDVPASETTHEFNALFFSDAGGPTSADATTWRSPAGITNKIVVDADDINDYGVGLAKVGSDLAVLKRNSLHILTGYDEDTFAIKTFSSDIGCVDKGSIVEHADGFFFMSDEGFMFCDGAQLQPVSESIRSELVDDIHDTVGHGWSDGGQVHTLKLPNHYILVSITNQTMSTGAVTTEKAWLYHETTGRWSRYHSNVTHNTVPVATGLAYETPFIIDGNNAIMVPHLTLPGNADENVRGMDTIGEFTNRIPAKWKSPLIRLSTPQYMSQIHRFFVEYTFTTPAGSDSDDYGWYISARNGNGTNVLPETQVEVMGTPSSYLYRRREVIDDFREASDIQLTVEWKDSPDRSTPAVANAVIYDCYVEYQTTRQRRST